MPELRNSGQFGPGNYLALSPNNHGTKETPAFTNDQRDWLLRTSYSGISENLDSSTQ